MMPKLMVLARRRASLSTALERHAEDVRGGAGVDVLAAVRRPPAAPAHRPRGPAAAARSGCSRPPAAHAPARPRRRGGCAAPSSVRIGMFCRFGSVEDSRPVLVMAMAKPVCTRPVARVDLRRQPVDIGRFQLGQLAPVEHARGQRHAPASASSSSTRGVGAPGAGLALALPPGSFISSNRISPELLGRADVEGLARRARGSRPPAPPCAAAKSSPMRAQLGAVHLDAGHLHVAQHGDHPALHLLVERQRAVRRAAAAAARATGAASRRHPRRHRRWPCRAAPGRRRCGRGRCRSPGRR